MNEIKDGIPGPATLKILLIEDDADDVLLFRKMLDEVPSFRCKLECAGRLSEAFQCLENKCIDVILLDLNLPDSQGLASYLKVHARKPSTSIIVLTGLADEEIALKAVKAGAQDYLVKGEATGPLLAKSMRYAVERKRFLVELENKNKEVTEITQQLWQSAKLATMGELAASIAHELNNPLATVSLRVESLLAETGEDDPRRKSLKVIDQEVERMADLVLNLLQFSRRSAPQISTVDICEEITNTLDLVSCHLRNRQIEIIKEFTADIPAIQADRQQLRQTLMNLFTNAGDAMPAGGKLTVRVSAGEEVYLEVADTGSGIPPEYLPKVFEPFFTTKSEGKGTGLGLPLCKRMVEDHGGTLHMTSALGEGTTVFIKLPIGGRRRNGSKVGAL